MYTKDKLAENAEARAAVNFRKRLETKASTRVRIDVCDVMGYKWEWGCL